MSFTAFCPSCGRNVQTKREDIDVGLAIFLLCCTWGIGLIIYLIVYYSQPESVCIFCDAKVEPYRGQPIERSRSSYQPTQNNFNSPREQYQAEEIPKEVKYNEVIKEKPNSKKFCPMCGEKFTPGQKFCENCGGSIKDYI